MEIPDADKELIWHEEVLPKKTRQALEFLSDKSWVGNQWYLAGGTALALREGHRTSLDLDFFHPDKTFNLNGLTSNISGEEWQIDFAEEGTVFASLFGAKVSFIAYPFFIHKQTPQNFGTISVLDARDIAVMKIIAISQRGRKRDFVDLYWYVKNRESFSAILYRLPEQYPAVAHDYHHILKSLIYFVDADQDPMPEIFFNATWREIKAYFEQEVPRITKEFLGLK